MPRRRARRRVAKWKLQNLWEYVRECYQDRDRIWWWPQCRLVLLWCLNFRHFIANVRSLHFQQSTSAALHLLVEEYASIFYEREDASFRLELQAHTTLLESSFAPRRECHQNNCESDISSMLEPRDPIELSRIEMHTISRCHSKTKERQNLSLEIFLGRLKFTI